MTDIGCHLTFTVWSVNPLIYTSNSQDFTVNTVNHVMLVESSLALSIDWPTISAGSVL